MVKDITELKSEEDLKEYLENQLCEITKFHQTVIDETTEIKYNHSNDIFHVKQVNDLEDMDNQSIFYYIQAIQSLALNIDEEAGRRLGHAILRIESRLHNIPEVFDALQIINHWKIFHDHLEENPTLKEEWDALMMGIKLTEDFD